jgi:hypothetical protein
VFLQENYTPPPAPAGKTAHGNTNHPLKAPVSAIRTPVHDFHNVLKNRGYNLEHNFGHGKNHACEVFFLPSLIAFQFHTILDLCDEDCQKARGLSSRRDEFFYHLQAALRYALHETWRGFLVFVRGEDSGDIPDG